MSSKNFALRIIGTIFFIVAVLHALRIITGVAITVDGWLVPVFVNWMGMVATAALCGWLWWLSFHSSDDSSRYHADKHTYH